MAPTLSSSLYTTVSLLLFSLLFSPSLADISPSVPVPPSTACNSTPDPHFCKSVLPSAGSSNLYDYGRFCVGRSLSMAKKFLALVERYLKNPSWLSETAVRALEDCKLLSGLNMDFLLSTAFELNNNTMQTDDYVQTLLSAIVTNQQTCLQGLQETSSSWKVEDGLYTPLTNGTNLYRVALALFTHAWVPERRRKRFPKRKLSFTGTEIVRNGILNLKMSMRNRKMLESRSRRRLLQASGGGGVLVRDVVFVSKDGSEHFTTINDALAAAPSNTNISDGYFLIYVMAGVYEEYVSVPKNTRNLMMIGDGINQTVITGNRSVVGNWTTFNSATFAVVGQGFVASDMTFRNTAGAVMGQAVAVRNGADLSTFYSCSFEGYQDTLYTHSLRQFYRECDIYGTVDFIFGNAAVVFQNCNMYARLPMMGQSNVITAQGRTDLNQNTGTSIHNCSIKAASDLAAAGGSTKTYLGRPWKEYSTTIYMQSFIDGLIDSSGWLPWSGDFALSTLYYAEYNNTGPGSGTGWRVKWPGYHPVINASVASTFTVSNFIVGDIWLPDTGAPFFGGLL